MKSSKQLSLPLNYWSLMLKDRRLMTRFICHTVLAAMHTLLLSPMLSAVCLIARKLNAPYVLVRFTETGALTHTSNPPSYLG